MKRIRLLDCTLREAPLDDLMWGNINLRKMIEGMAKSKIDIIECGFLKDEKYLVGSSSFNRVEEIEKILVNKDRNVLYTVLVDYGRYDLKNLSVNNGLSIDAIRVCFKKNEIFEVLDYAQSIRELGYEVCIQHVDTMAYTDEEIIDFIKKVNEFKPFSYSIVDTFGAMYQQDMLHYYELAEKYLDNDIVLGFHAHNNLMLADANVQRFISEILPGRHVIVDASLFGCGRGAGNAHTELVAEFINKTIEPTYDTNGLLDLIDTVVVPMQDVVDWGYSIPYFIAGINNAHSFNVKYLMDRHNIKFKDLCEIIGKLDVNEKKKYDYELLESLYVDHFSYKVNDEATIQGLSLEFNNREILLLASGKSILTERDKISKFIEDKNPIVIGVNNYIDGYSLDYIFYSGVHRYNLLKYQDLGTKTDIILTSNINAGEDCNHKIVDYRSLIKLGWKNFDSSAILLLRLLIKCNVSNINIAGMDGYLEKNDTFYKKELETGLDSDARLSHRNDNIAMLKDLNKDHPNVNINFITTSIYAKKSCE